MKTINEMSLEELAEYVVTLPGWRQPRGALLAECDAALDKLEYQIDQCSFGASRDFLYSVFEEFAELFHTLHPTKPDLNDPATLGCLLAMVRKKHKANLWCEHFYALDTIEAWKVVKTRGYFNQIVADGRTEAHALVAALAKEAA